MKKFQAVSRVLAVAVVAFVGNSFATCPLFNNPVVRPLSNNLINNKFALGSGLILSDHLCNKNDHAKKAFLDTVGYSMDRKTATPEVLVGHLATNYAVRKVSAAANLNGFRDSLLKKCDVLPEGAIRDEVNAAVEGVAGVATNPETLTLVILGVIKAYASKS